MASSSQQQNSYQATSSMYPKTNFPCSPPPASPIQLKSPITSSHTDYESPNSSSIAKAAFTPSPEDLYFSKSTHLMPKEVLRHRSHQLKQLSKCYRDHYWALIEELRVQYRDYVWKYGLSPFEEDEGEIDCVKEELKDGIFEGSGETNNRNSGNSSLLCAFYGCKLKAMALTRFCQLHILSDAKQQLYKPCDYVIKSAQAGPITCGKPILRSTIPSFCNVHIQKAQKHVTRALKKAGLNVTSSNKLAPKFHVIVAEYVREIQGKRRAALSATRNKVVAKHEHGS